MCDLFRCLVVVSWCVGHRAPVCVYVLSEGVCVFGFADLLRRPLGGDRKMKQKKREAGGDWGTAAAQQQEAAHSYSSFSHTPTLHAIATKRFRFRNNERVKISCSASRQLLSFFSLFF